MRWLLVVTYAFLATLAAVINQYASYPLFFILFLLVLLIFLLLLSLLADSLEGGPYSPRSNDRDPSQWRLVDPSYPRSLTPL